MSDAAQVTAVHKSFRTEHTAVKALDGIDLVIPGGSFTAIMGASGSGKSTLLNVLTGLTAPDSGTVTIAGRDLATMDDQALTIFRRRHIGIVFQAFNLIPVLSACDNVALPLLLDGVARRDAVSRATTALTKVGLAERATHRPDALSGGEQQRVAIARALISDPALILADEPTGNLDSHNAELIRELLITLHRDDGRTVLIITHEAQVAYAAQSVVVLADGRVRGRVQTSEVGSAADLARVYLEMTARKATA